MEHPENYGKRRIIVEKANNDLVVHLGPEVGAAFIAGIEGSEPGPHTFLIHAGNGNLHADAVFACGMLHSSALPPPEEAVEDELQPLSGGVTLQMIVFGSLFRRW